VSATVATFRKCPVLWSTNAGEPTGACYDFLFFNFQLDEEENFYETIGCSENSNVIILIMLYFFNNK
jgi:hypothetical protein